jgi:hypothetical protein
VLVYHLIDLIVEGVGTHRFVGREVIEPVLEPRAANGEAFSSGDAPEATPLLLKV